MTKTTWIIVALLPLAGCSQTDWDEEVLVHLFKAGDFESTRVTVQASQGAHTAKETIDRPFDDCSSNRVRIVPRREDGLFPPLTVHVNVEGNPMAPTVSQTISLPAEDPIAIVLGTGSQIKPAGCPLADAGGDDGGETDGGVKRATGDPCDTPEQCAGGLCMEFFTAKNVDISLPDGYCSADCANVACESDERCVSETDGLGGSLSRRCLRTCELPRDCGRDASYNCTTDSLCLPK